MNIVRRIANEKRQFVLPALPLDISLPLALLVAAYCTGFESGSEEGVKGWDDAAARIHAFQPQSLADLAAKLILSIHFRDPEISSGELAIDAHEAPNDTLALEMELSCVDWLLANAPSSPNAADWALAEAAYAKADAELEALAMPYTDEEIDRLADAHNVALDGILHLPATTLAQAHRKIELAMFDATTVRTGVDFPALLADARRLAALGPSAAWGDSPPDGWVALAAERARLSFAEDAADAAGDEAEADRQQALRFLVENKLMAMPAADGAGLALKILIAIGQDRASIPYQEEIEADAERLVAQREA